MKTGTYDIENSTITADQVITILYQIFIIGSNGTRFSFIPFRQYVICGETTVTAPPDTCLPCDERLSPTAEYWKVCINSEEFLIPKAYTAIENYIRTENEQDLKKYWEYLHQKYVKDFKGWVKRLTGREINTGNPDIGNQALYQEIQRAKARSNGKVYGNTYLPDEDGTVN